MVRQLDYTKVNPRKLRRIKRDVCHTFDISQLERLGSWLFDDCGKLEVVCQFEFDSTDTIKMAMTLNGKFNFLCQRCAKSFEHDWSSQTSLLLDEEDVKTEGLADEQYERISLSYDGSFNLIDVITDEIILGMPKIHQTECQHDRGFEF